MFQPLPSVDLKDHYYLSDRANNFLHTYATCFFSSSLEARIFQEMYHSPQPFMDQKFLVHIVPLMKSMLEFEPTDDVLQELLTFLTHWVSSVRSSRLDPPTPLAPDFQYYFTSEYYQIKYVAQHYNTSIQYVFSLEDPFGDASSQQQNLTFDLNSLPPADLSGFDVDDYLNSIPSSTLPTLDNQINQENFDNVSSTSTMATSITPHYDTSYLQQPSESESELDDFTQELKLPPITPSVKNHSRPTYNFDMVGKNLSTHNLSVNTCQSIESNSSTPTTRSKKKRNMSDYDPTNLIPNDQLARLVQKLQTGFVSLSTEVKSQRQTLASFHDSISSESLQKHYKFLQTQLQQQATIQQLQNDLQQHRSTVYQGIVDSAVLRNQLQQEQRNMELLKKESTTQIMNSASSQKALEQYQKKIQAQQIELDQMTETLLQEKKLVQLANQQQKRILEDLATKFVEKFNDSLSQRERHFTNSLNEKGENMFQHLKTQSQVFGESKAYESKLMDQKSNYLHQLRDKDDLIAKLQSDIYSLQKVHQTQHDTLFQYKEQNAMFLEEIERRKKEVLDIRQLQLGTLFESVDAKFELIIANQERSTFTMVGQMDEEPPRRPTIPQPYFNWIENLRRSKTLLEEIHSFLYTGHEYPAIVGLMREGFTHNEDQIKSINPAIRLAELFEKISNLQTSDSSKQNHNALASAIENVLQSTKNILPQLTNSSQSLLKHTAQFEGMTELLEKIQKEQKQSVLKEVPLSNSMMVSEVSGKAMKEKLDDLEKSITQLPQKIQDQKRKTGPQGESNFSFKSLNQMGLPQSIQFNKLGLTNQEILEKKKDSIQRKLISPQLPTNLSDQLQDLRNSMAELQEKKTQSVTIKQIEDLLTKQKNDEDKNNDPPKQVKSHPSTEPSTSDKTKQPKMIPLDLFNLMIDNFISGVYTRDFNSHFFDEFKNKIMNKASRISDEDFRQCINQPYLLMRRLFKIPVYPI